MKRIAIYAVIIAILAALGSWWFSPTQVLKRRTSSLLSTLTLDSGGGKIGRQAGAYSLNALLADQVELENDAIKEANGSFERQELESAYSWLCEQAKQTHFELTKFTSVTITGEKAKVDCTLVGLVELPNYRPADGTYDVSFDWRKEKEGWRLTRATWKQVP